MTDVPLTEAEGRIAELVARVEAGEEMRILRGGRPVARIVRVAPSPTPPQGGFDFRDLERLTRDQPLGQEVVQTMRDASRY